MLLKLGVVIFYIDHIAPKGTTVFETSVMYMLLIDSESIGGTYASCKYCTPWIFYWKMYKYCWLYFAGFC